MNDNKTDIHKIQFNHIYRKLLDNNSIIIETAILLQVLKIDIESCSSAFTEYDTDTGKYSLPTKGNFILLIFEKPFIYDRNLFTTLRKHTEQKFRYYVDLIGNMFNICINNKRRNKMRLGEWTSIKDELPKIDHNIDNEHGGNVVVNYRSIRGTKFDDVNNVTIACYMHDIGQWYRHDDIELDYVTHWMPLPALPKETK